MNKIILPETRSLDNFCGIKIETMNAKLNRSIARLIVLSLILFSSLASVSANTPFSKNTKRILFLGNSITYNGTYVSDLEAYFISYYPESNYEFINAGLPSETVSGLSEEGHAGGKFPRPNLHSRIHNVLELTNPDIVFVSYGMNDGIYERFSKEYFNAYKNGMGQLDKILKEYGVKRIIYLSPSLHEDSKLGLHGYNLVLDKYSDWLVSQQKTSKWEIVDIHSALKKYLKTKHKTESKFKLSPDGVHPEALGHWLMAREILIHLGEKGLADVYGLESALSNIENGNEILKLVNQRQTIMKDSWLSAIGHERPEMNKGMALDRAKEKYDKIGERIRSLASNEANKRIIVACIGNSITQGVGVANPNYDSYPVLLQDMLGYDYDVRDFGVSGSTALNHGNIAYEKTGRYKEALNSNPDIVSIKLGTNDSRMGYRELIADSFTLHYQRIVKSFQNLPSKPRIILILPVSSYLTNADHQKDSVIVADILPRIQEIAFYEKLDLIDMHSLTSDRNDLFPDNLHPNKEGMRLIATNICNTIKHEKSTFDIFSKLERSYKLSSFHGYDCADFEFEGRNAKIVKPRIVAEAKPWIWRARFWGHEAQTDIALLDRGYHIVYCDVVELFGNQEAVDLWNKYYSFLTSKGLNKKTVLEGMSRGGIYIYNWAAQNPEKVAAVYADAPVLDLRSWPGGKAKGKGSVPIGIW